MADDKHRLEIEIVANTDKAVQEIEKVKAAEDQLRDKTVTINVVTKNSGGGGDAAKGLESHASAARKAADAAQRLERASGSSGNAMAGHSSATDSAARSMRSYGSEASNADAATRTLAGSTERAAGSMRSMETAGRSMERVATSVRATADASEIMAGGMQRADRVMASAGSSAVKMSAGMSAVAPALRSMSFDEVISGSLGGAQGMEEFTSAAKRAAGIGGGGGGGIPPIKDAAGDLGGFGEEASGAAKAADKFSVSGRQLAQAGMAAGVAWLGMAALTAGTAAIGGAGAFLGMRQAPQLMHAAQQGVKGFNDEFKKTRQAMTDAGAPAMAGLAASAKSLGAELAHVGVDNIGTMLAGASSIVGGVTAAINKLEPAIKPATGAVVAGVNAITGAVGNSAPAITSFASSIMQNAPGIQSALEGVVSVASVGGQALNSFVGAAGPMLKEAGNVASLVTDLGSGNEANLGAIGMPNVKIPGFSGAVSSASGALPSWARGALADFAGSGFGMPTLAPSTQGLAAAIRGGETGQGTFGATMTETPSAPGVRPVASAGRPAGQAYEAGAFPGRSYQSHVDAGGNVVSDLYGANAQSGPGVPSMGTVPPPAPPPGQAPPPGAAPAAPGATGPSPTAMMPGPGMGGPRPMSADLAAATQQAQQAQQALQQIGPTAQQSMQQASAATQTGSQGVRQGMQQATQAVSQATPAMQSAASQIPHAIAQGANSQPGQVASAVNQQVHAATSSAAPAASAGGGSAGAAMGSAMGKSLTKTESNTMTIAEKWSTKVSAAAAPAAASGGADAGAAMGTGMGKSFTTTVTDVVTEVHKLVKKVENVLGIASPSRVFMGIGQNVGQGLVLGMKSTSGAIGTASQQMATNVVQSATTALGGNGGAAQQMTAGVGNRLAGLGQQYGQQFAGSFSAQAGGNQYGRQFGQVARPGGRVPTNQQGDPTIPQYPGGSQGQQLTPQQQAELQRQQQQQRPGQMFGLDANGNPIKPEDAIKSGMFPEGSQAAFRARALGRITNEPTAYLQRAQAHNDRAADLRAQIKQRHEDAQSAARQGITPNEAAAQRIAQEQQQAMQQAHVQNQADHQNMIQQSLDPFRQTDQQPQSVQSLIDQSRQQGQQIGQALGQGVTQGTQQSTPDAAAAAVAMAAAQQEEAKKKHGIASPSTVFAQIGSEVGAGMSQGIASASNSIQGVASDRGLQVGYTYGRNFVTGAQSVIQKDLFQGISRPQIDSPQAMAALGAAGLLGPAGSGAQIPKSRTVTLSPSSSASGSAQPIQVHVFLDGQPFDDKIVYRVDQAVDQITDAIALQRSA